MPSLPDDQLTPNRTLVTTYEGYDHDRQRPLYAVAPESFQAIMEGLACGNCLKYFNGVFCAICPDCGEPTGPTQATEAWWTDFPELVK